MAESETERERRKERKKYAKFWEPGENVLGEFVINETENAMETKVKQVCVCV